MFLKQFFNNVAQQSSFFLGCEITRKAVVIDPDRFVKKYIQLAISENFEITHIVNTVGGMEQISGSRFLAQKVNATVFFSSELSEDWKYNFDHKKINSGDNFQVGSYCFEALQAAFHYGDKISYLITKNSKDNPYLFITEEFMVKWNFVSSQTFKKIRFNPATKSREKMNLFSANDSSRMLEQQKTKRNSVAFEGFADYSIEKNGFQTSNSSKEYKRWILSSMKDYSSKLLKSTIVKSDFIENNKSYTVIDRKKNVGLQGGIKLKKLGSDEWIKLLTKETRVLHIMDSNSDNLSHLPNSIEIKTEESLRIWLKKLEEYGEDYIIFSENEDVHSVENVMFTLGCEHALGHFFPTNFYWSQQKSKLSMA